MFSFLALWSQNAIWIIISLICGCSLCSPMCGHFLWLFLRQQKEDDVLFSGYRVWYTILIMLYTFPIPLLFLSTWSIMTWEKFKSPNIILFLRISLTVFPSYLFAPETFLTVRSSVRDGPFSDIECCPLSSDTAF